MKKKFPYNPNLTDVAHIRQQYRFICRWSKKSDTKVDAAYAKWKKNQMVARQRKDILGDTL